MRHLGVQAENRDIDDLFKDLDGNGNGCLDLQELTFALKLLELRAQEKACEDENAAARKVRLEAEVSRLETVIRMAQVAEEALAKYAVANGVASGLQWRKCKTRPSPEGNLMSKALEERLAQKTNFTQAEWDTLGINELHMHQWVKVGPHYYQPAVQLATSRERQLLQDAADEARRRAVHEQLNLQDLLSKHEELDRQAQASQDAAKQLREKEEAAERQKVKKREMAQKKDRAKRVAELKEKDAKRVSELKEKDASTLLAASSGGVQRS